MFSCELIDLPLKLKYTWKISRNSSDFKHNFLVKLRFSGLGEFMGEVAPNIRYKETPEIIRAQFEQIVQELQVLKTEDALQRFLDEAQLCNSLRFGIESAFLHYYAAVAGGSISQYLGLTAPKQLATSYTIPILAPEEIHPFMQQHDLHRFESIKLKVGKEGMLDIVDALSRTYSGLIRIDANEAYTDPDVLMKELEQLKKYNIEFVEQPFPEGTTDPYRLLKKHSPYPIIADESVTSDPDIALIASCFDGINMKLMKSGGYRKGINILENARQNGLKTMIGCMIETTVGIFSAFNLCNEVNYIDLDGFFLVENEPFKQISEEKGKLFYLT